MPLYEYRCKKCNTVTERLQKNHMTQIWCESCGEDYAKFTPSRPGYRRDQTVIDNTPDEEKLIVYPETGY